LPALFFAGALDEGWTARSLDKFLGAVPLLKKRWRPQPETRRLVQFANLEIGG